MEIMKETPSSRIRGQHIVNKEFLEIVVNGKPTGAGVLTRRHLGPDYHRLKTMVKRSVEQEIRNKNFGARSGNFEKNAVVKNQGTKQRGQRILGHCWQWEANGQCSKGDNCSFRHDVHKRAKLTQPNPSPSFFHAAE